MYKYCPIYLKGSTPIIEENDIFRQTVQYEKEKTEVTNAEKVLALLQENPKMTAKEMAGITSLSLRTIRNILADLTNKNIIERQGADKKGSWIIKEI